MYWRFVSQNLVSGEETLTAKDRANTWGIMVHPNPFH